MIAMWYRLGQALEWLILLATCSLALSYSSPRLADEVDRVRAYTRQIEFDYLGWMLHAASLKAEQSAVGVPGYMDYESTRVAVSDYLWLIQRISQANDALTRIYADPAITDKEAASTQVRTELEGLREREDQVAPIAEGILQAQVTQVAADLGLTTLGQPIPSVLYHSTDVPDALIVSPRNHIEEIANISVTPGLPVDQQASLESRVERGLNVAALVVPIGGVGVYPTMIMQTTDLTWLTSTIAHEWTHNFLEFRPLGLLYERTDQLRTMNETAADIVGSEVGTQILRRYYPDLQRATQSGLALTGFPRLVPGSISAANPPFDFRAEMHTTRVNVDALLAAGQITQAEQYMEQRRQIFVQNGYVIRRLNQAYFAFYGAYADVPGGAAGEDPVGPAVRALRAESPTLAAFLNRISWMTSFDQLKKAVGQ